MTVEDLYSILGEFLDDYSDLSIGFKGRTVVDIFYDAYHNEISFKTYPNLLWTSVKQSLPNENETVLCFVKDKSNNKSYPTLTFRDGDFYDEDNDECGEVLYWQPLIDPE